MRGNPRKRHMQAHRIILLNFTERECKAVTEAGYNVDAGVLRHPNNDMTYCPFKTPHPLYEYDILFYNANFSAVPNLKPSW